MRPKIRVRYITSDRDGVGGWMELDPGPPTRVFFFDDERDRVTATDLLLFHRDGRFLRTYATILKPKDFDKC